MRAHRHDPPTAKRNRRHLLALTGLWPALSVLPVRALAGSDTPPSLVAPNVVVISPRLVTSGQPRADMLARLGALGFGAVVYLAPPTVEDAVPDEAAILERQGINFVNIPIPFNRPTAADFERFVSTLADFGERRVLVHCQVNLRASSLVFLQRVIAGHEAPEVAYAAVAKVWSPRGPWKDLIVAQLRQHQINFEPY